jgi:hypothetical protein
MHSLYPHEKKERLARPTQGKGRKSKIGNALLIQEAVTSMASLANEYVSKEEGKILSTNK